MAKRDQGCMAGVIGFVFFVIVAIIIGTCDNKKGPKKSNSKARNSGGYEITFTTNFKAGMASVDDLGLSVVIAVDCSGSMADPPKASSVKPKYSIASESLTEIVNFLESYYQKSLRNEKLVLKIGLIKFSTHPQQLFELTEMDEASFAALRRITSDKRNFEPDGTTAIGETLEMGTEMVLQSGTIFKSLIVITDGANTEGIDPETVLRAIVENRNSRNTREFPVLTSTILTSFVGFDVDGSTFAGLNRIGSRVMSADNKEELNETLKTIFLADITKLESK